MNISQLMTGVILTSMSESGTHVIFLTLSLSSAAVFSMRISYRESNPATNVFTIASAKCFPRHFRDPNPNVNKLYRSLVSLATTGDAQKKYFFSLTSVGDTFSSR